MVAHRNTATTQVTAAGTTLTVNMPTDVEGDLVCVDFAISTPGAAHVISATGWTSLKDEFISAASNAGGSTLYRLSPAGGLPSTVAFTSTQSVGFDACATSYSDPDPTTPIGVTGATGTGNSTSPQAPGVTVPNDSSILRYVQANDDDDNGTMPGGMTSRYDNGNATPTNGRWLVVSDEAEDAGASGVRTGSIAASEEWAAWMYAINPVLTSYEFSGVTKDEAGDAEVSCDVYAIEEGTPPIPRGHVVSNGTTGAYSFTGLGNTNDHLAVAFKDGTPDIMDATDPITPTET